MLRDQVRLQPPLPVSCDQPTDDIFFLANSADHHGDQCRKSFCSTRYGTLVNYGHQVLGGVADTVAQLITAVKARSAQRRSENRDDFMSIEIHDLDKEKPPAVGEIGYYRTSPPPFDFERLTRFMAYGFFMAPVQFQWFGFLSRAFPLTKKQPTTPALKRVVLDQLIMAPIGMKV